MKLNLRFLFILVALFWFTNLPQAYAQEPNYEHQFNPNFKEDYSGRRYDYEGKKIISASKSSKGTYSKYSENTPVIKETHNEENASVTISFVNWIFITILVLAILYLAFTLLNEGSSSLFTSGGQKKINSYEEITSDNIMEVDINALIAQAENGNDYRLAIRYYYLLVLKTLTQQKFITYEDDKTNSDYMEAIVSQKFSNNFSYISYIYNYTWYGEFALNTVQYETARNSFVHLIKDIRS